MLNKYGIDVLVLDGFDRFTGKVRTLAAALSDPAQTEWKLMQADEQSMLFMRHPPAGRAAAQQPGSADQHRKSCRVQIEHDPRKTAPAPRESPTFTA